MPLLPVAARSGIASAFVSIIGSSAASGEFWVKNALPRRRCGAIRFGPQRVNAIFSAALLMGFNQQLQTTTGGVFLTGKGDGSRSDPE